MKNVETTTGGWVGILVTGFGAFPGAPTNPSAAILARLARHRGRLAKLGIRLEIGILPVVFTEVEAALDALTHNPARILDCVLHLGLASRRQEISVETRAINRAGPLHPDASGRRAAQVISPGAPLWLKAPYPASRIAAAMRTTGIPARPSIDAGDYVCNTTLYLTLAQSRAPLAGFLHVPKTRVPCVPTSRLRRRRPTLENLTRAVVATVLVMARDTRRARAAAAGLLRPPPTDQGLA